MLIHPQFDPVALALGPIHIHWYGLSYMLAFALFWWLALRRTQMQPSILQSWQKTDIEDLIYRGSLGVILGGRLGYVLFYKPAYYWQNPLEVFMLWQGGMAFHGGLLGVLLAMAWYAHRQKRAYLQVTDLIAPCVPVGLACGRMANFINGELWGRLADPHLPWVMVFPQSGIWLPRHPSQLYQFALEGLLLFVLLWWYGRKPRGLGQVSGAFLMGYAIFRFIAEYFREPDAFLGLLSGGMSMGQWLCVPMFAAGLVLWWRGRYFMATQAV
jgi:phosphatidylglycerol:prolipoprotein diacylglycerol transferase